MVPPPPISKDQVEVLTSLLESKGLDAGDLIDAIQVVAAAKRAAGKVPPASADEEGRSYYLNKELIFPGIPDAFVFQNGQTKSRSWYLRVKQPGKPPFLKSLGRSVTTREMAVAHGQMLYQEIKGKIDRGEKRVSLNTETLVKKYLAQEAKSISPFPKQGITEETYKAKKTYLNLWLKYIQSLKLEKKKLEEIDPDIGKEFRYWVQKQEKAAYKDRGYSAEYINSALCEIKRMYYQYAVEEKYITQVSVPKFKYLLKSPEKGHRREILLPEEWRQLTDYMRSKKYLQGHRMTLAGEVKMVKDKSTGKKVPCPITKLEMLKRQVFRHYMLIAYAVGARPGELMKMTWGDISINRMDSKENQQTHRLMKVRAENSKTGRSRVINANVARWLERLEKLYVEYGMECLPHHFIFRNPTPERMENNIAWGQPALTKRLKDVLLWSGVQKSLDARSAQVVLYSQRHAYVTWRLEAGVDIHLLSRNIGSSVTYIEQNYSHVEVAKSTEEITKGMYMLKTLEEVDR